MPSTANAAFLLAVDLDGTLLRGDARVAPEDAAALDRARERPSAAGLPHGVTVHSSVPVAPWYVTVIFVTPSFTPTTVPELSTVAVCGLSVDHDASEVTSFFVPSGIVARAVSFREFVRLTTHGDGDNSIADTFGDGVDEAPHAAETAASVQETAIPVFITSPVLFSPAAAGEPPAPRVLARRGPGAASAADKSKPWSPRA